MLVASSQAPGLSAMHLGESEERTVLESERFSIDTAIVYTFLAIILSIFLFGARKVSRLRLAFANMKTRAPALSEYRFRDFLYSKLAHWYSWTDNSSFILLSILILSLVAIGGFLRWLFTKNALGSSFWVSWIWLIQPDGGASEEESLGRMVGFFVSIGGLLVFASIITLVGQKFSDLLEGLKDGSFPIIESDHILICGWNSSAALLIEELCIAAENEGGGKIVILADMPKPEIEAIIQGAIDAHNSVICVMSGKPQKEANLKRVSAQSARSLIILNDESVPREERDLRSLRTMLVANRHQAKHRRMVVQCSISSHSTLMQQLGGPNVEVIDVDDYCGRLMVQCSRRPGLSSVFDVIFSFQEDKLYIHSMPELKGRTFGEVFFSCPHAIPVGIVTKTGTELLPPSDRIITDEDELLVFAGNSGKPEAHDCPIFNSESYCSERELSSRPGLSRRTVLNPLDSTARRHDTKLTPQPDPEKASRRDAFWRVVREAFAMPQGCAEKGAFPLVSPLRCEQLIILGWNDMAGTIVGQLDNLVAEGSEIYVFSATATADREQYLALEAERKNRKLQNSTLIHIEGSLGDHLRIRRMLPFEHATAIYVLSEQTIDDPEEADGTTLAVLINVQHILIEMGLEEFPTIIPETICHETGDQCVLAGCKDYIGSHRLCSRILACVCWEPKMNQVFHSALSGRQCFITIYGVIRFLVPEEERVRLSREEKSQLLPKEVSFYEVMAMAHSFGDLVVGWTKPGSAASVKWNKRESATQAKSQGLHNLKVMGLNGIWQFNPPDKHLKRPWTDRDRLVVLSKMYVQE